MVGRAVELLGPQPGERVLDLFCGLGNFSLPLARRAGEVVGRRGRRRTRVARRGAMRARQGIANVDLSWRRTSRRRRPTRPGRARTTTACCSTRRAPGRARCCRSWAAAAPDAVVYISCHPGSLARDAGILVREHGFRLVGGRRHGHVPAHHPRRGHGGLRALTRCRSRSNASSWWRATPGAAGVRRRELFRQGYVGGSEAVLGASARRRRARVARTSRAASRGASAAGVRVRDPAARGERDPRVGCARTAASRSGGTGCRTPATNGKWTSSSATNAGSGRRRARTRLTRRSSSRARAGSAPR